MNNGNILYAFLGGLIVALVWVASSSLTMQSFLVGLSAYAIVAALLVVFQDYDRSVKSLR